VAHQAAHAALDATSRLSNFGQSRALNEGFARIVAEGMAPRPREVLSPPTADDVVMSAFHFALNGEVPGASVPRLPLERVFGRAFTILLPPHANLHMARMATMQAARDLGDLRGLMQWRVGRAWTRAGVN
jgi:Zn-dependent metalloprotease